MTLKLKNKKTRKIATQLATAGSENTQLSAKWGASRQNKAELVSGFLQIPTLPLWGDLEWWLHAQSSALLTIPYSTNYAPFCLLHTNHIFSISDDLFSHLIIYPKPDCHCSSSLGFFYSLLYSQHPDSIQYTVDRSTLWGHKRTMWCVYH